MGFSAYKQYQLVSPEEDRKVIHGCLENIFQDDPEAEFTLLNIYKELPITSQGRIVEIKKTTVEFQTNAMQFSVISEAREVLIQSNTMGSCFIAKALELDNRRLQITMGEFSYAEVHADKRISVRVRLKLPMQLQLAVDGNKLSGVIHDISIGGVCVRTFAGEAMARADKIELRLKLLHAGTGELLDVLIPSRLLRVDKSELQAKCVLLFEHTPRSEQVLSTFIYQRQLEIIKELKAKCAPLTEELPVVSRADSNGGRLGNG
jgi:hypothetical protein